MRVRIYIHVIYSVVSVKDIYCGHICNIYCGYICNIYCGYICNIYCGYICNIYCGHIHNIYIYIIFGNVKIILGCSLI